jgi:hypothetical protein
MKRLKGLKLPVGNENGAGGCGGSRMLPPSGASLVMSVSFLGLGAKKRGTAKARRTPRKSLIPDLNL